jgi:DNA-3-methyladenine glycosylase II
MSDIRFALDSAPPYDFLLSTRLFSFGKTPAENCFRVALRLGRTAALVSVTGTGSVDQPEIGMTVRGDKSLTRSQIEEAKILTTSILNLSLDLMPFYQFVEEDPILSQITDQLRGLKPRKTPTVFESLVRSIIEQQISLIAAHHIQDRMIQAYGERLTLKEDTFYVFPNPEQLARSTEENLRACGLSRNKARYILGVAKAVAEGTFQVEDLRKEENASRVLSILKEIRGIGQWTAEMVMLRGIGKYSEFPADDLGLRKTLSHFYRKGVLMNAEEARQLAERWGPWKGLAGFYLIATEMSDLQLTRYKNSTDLK